MNIKNITLKIVRDDITALDVEAIVNPANTQLLMGGGLAGAIKKKGGAAIEAEAVKKAPIPVGAAVATGAGKLKAKHVIHAPTMGMDFQTDEHKVRQACAAALRCAADLQIASVALPALGCGVGGFPLLGASKIMAQEILKFARHVKSSLREIVLCLYDDETHQVFNESVTGYIRHIQEDLGLGPYVTVDIIIELPEGIILIERSNPPYGWALPGGFVDYGESLEEAAVREAKEETNMDLADLRQFHAYSAADRDPRFQTVSTVFIAKGVGNPRFGDDAKGLKVLAYKDLVNFNCAFDHHQIIQDYLRRKK